MIKIITEKITRDDLRAIAKEQFGDMVKAVADIEEKIMAIGGELHADEEALLLRHGSRQENLWGINLYPDIAGDAWIEFNSMINFRPSSGNRTRGVDNAAIRQKIKAVADSLIA